MEGTLWAGKLEGEISKCLGSISISAEVGLSGGARHQEAPARHRIKHSHSLLVMHPLGYPSAPLPPSPRTHCLTPRSQGRVTLPVLHVLGEGAVVQLGEQILLQPLNCGGHDTGGRDWAQGNAWREKSDAPGSRALRLMSRITAATGPWAPLLHLHKLAGSACERPSPLLPLTSTAASMSSCEQPAHSGCRANAASMKRMNSCTYGGRRRSRRRGRRRGRGEALTHRGWSYSSCSQSTWQYGTTKLPPPFSSLPECPPRCCR